MVSTHLKNMSEHWESSPCRGEHKKCNKNVWNHHLGFLWYLILLKCWVPSTLLRSIPKHTPGVYPRHPQIPKWKEFLHKVLVQGVGYVPGVCWKSLFEPCIIREPDKTLKPLTSHLFKMLHWNFHISHDLWKGKSQGGKKTPSSQTCAGLVGDM